MVIMCNYGLHIITNISLLTLRVRPFMGSMSTMAENMNPAIITQKPFPPKDAHKTRKVNQIALTRVVRVMR